MTICLSELPSHDACGRGAAEGALAPLKVVLLEETLPVDVNTLWQVRGSVYFVL